MLSSLIVVNVWTSSKVKHFSICRGTSGVASEHSEGITQCTDRLCLITETSEVKVQSVVTCFGLLLIISGVDPGGSLWVPSFSQVVRHKLEK